MKLAGMHRSISFAYGDAYLGAMRLSYNFVLQPFIFLFIAISLRSIALGMLKPLTLRSFDRLSFITFLTFLLSRTYKTISQMSTFRFFAFQCFTFARSTPPPSFDMYKHSNKGWAKFRHYYSAIQRLKYCRNSARYERGSGNYLNSSLCSSCLRARTSFSCGSSALSFSW
jgi:hypothetical protein